MLFINVCSAFTKKIACTGMKDKGDYWYKNSTLLEALSITPEEQKHMTTIIGLEEKYRRNNAKRKEEMKRD